MGSCGSISELPHGLALLVATRKIQSVYRAKLARGIMRGKRAEKMSMSRPSTADGKPAKWMKMHDHHSGYDYYYNNEDGSTTWDVPQDFIEPMKTQVNENELVVVKEEEEEKAEEEKEIQFDEWSEVYDPASGCNYYQNLLDETVTQWELPNGFDPVAARKRVKLLMSCGSISELPHGLALLVATRKIQSVYRAKLARGIM